jgi:hypothetical protein
MPDATPPTETRFECVTIYGALTDQPLVEVRWPVTLPVMVSPAEARRMAMILLEAANAAEMDAIVYRWMRGRMGMTTEQSAMVMADFRRIRASLDPDATP